MIDEFDKIFFRILLKRSKIDIKKQSLIAVVALSILLVSYIISPEYTKLFIAIFLIFISITCLLENEIFLEKDDFKVLDIEMGSFRFYKSYIIQRIVKDNFLTNIIVVLGFAAFLIYRDIWGFVWFTLAIAVYTLYMPTKHIMGKVYSNISMVLAIVDIIIMLLLGIALYQRLEIINVILLLNINIINVLSLLGIIVGVFIVSFVLNNNGSIKTILGNIKLKSSNKSIRWIKKIDMYLYKDFVMNKNFILMNILGMILSFWIMSDLLEMKDAYSGVVFFIASNGIFTAKQKKKYKLISDDSFFYSNNISEKDIKYCNFKKMCTILTEIIVKIVISIAILMIHREFKLGILIELIIIFTLIALISFIVVLRNNTLSTIYLNVIKFSIVIIALVRGYSNMPYIVYYGYLAVVAIGTMIMVFLEIMEGKNNNEKEICSYK